MVAQYADVGSGQSSGGNITVSKPATTVNGDLLVAIGFADPDGTTFTAPGGWTQSGSTYATNEGDAKVWWKVASSEPSTWTWTADGLASRTVWVLRITGADTTTPFDVTPTFATSATATTAQVAPTISPTGTDSLLVVGIQALTGGATGTYTWTVATERADGQPSGTYIMSTVATQELTASGATGTRTATATASKTWNAVSFAIKSTASGTTYTPTPTDAVGTTDSATTAADVTRTSVDPIGVTDSASRAQAAVRAPADQAGITDAAVTGVIYVRAVDDGLGIADSATVPPPPATQHSIFDGAPPAGSYTLLTDGSPSIQLGQTFYTLIDTFDGGECVGGRLWCPSGVTMPATVTIRAWLNPLGTTGSFTDVLTDTPLRETTVSTITGPGWVDATWAPFDVPDSGVGILIGYTFPGAPTNYLYTSGLRGDNNPIYATDASGLVLPPSTQVGPNGSFAHAYFKIGTGPPSAAFSDGTGYGIDILLEAAAVDTPVTPADPVGITDTVGLTRSVAVAVADGVGVSDSAVGVGGKQVLISDGVGITDTDTDQTLNIVETTDDPVALGDTIAYTYTATRASVDPVGVTDAAVAVLSTAGDATTADPVGVTDAVTAVMARVVTVADFLAIADTASAVGVGQPIGSAADPVGISDSAVAVLARVITVTDVVGARDTATTSDGLRNITVLSATARRRWSSP